MNDRNDSASVEIHPLIAERRSPRAYSDAPVDHAQVLSVLEAARWAPSAFNVQPWRFVVFERGGDRPAFDCALSTLIPFNQSWNTNAQVLIAVLADTLDAKGAANPSASHDAGAATMAMLLQAHALGLAAHAMSGLDADAFRRTFAVPDRFQMCSMVSIAHHGTAAMLPAALAEREKVPRSRLPLERIAHFGVWPKGDDAG